MSDYVRTTLAYSVVECTTGRALFAVSDLLDPKFLPSGTPVLRTFSEAREQYERQEWTSWNMPAVRSLSDLVAFHFNMAVDVSVPFDGRRYGCTLFAFKVADTSADRCITFLRISLPSSLTYALRGTREFGGPIRIDAEVKRDLLRYAIGGSRALNANAFVFGLEGDGLSPFTAAELVHYVKEPLRAKPPVPPYAIGVSASMASRAEIVAAWQPESPIVQAGSIHIVDLLHDSDGLVNEDSSDADYEE
jgi:hypothetical protein